MNKYMLAIGLIILTVFSVSAMASGAAPSKSPGPKVSMAAADFTLKDLNGKDVTLSGFKGKPVLLVFGATWCPYCVEEVKDLNAFFDKHQDKDVKVLSVDIQESAAKVSGFAKKHNIKYTVLLDEKGEAAKKYEVYGIPAFFLIDKDGAIKHSGTGKPEGGFEALLK